MSVTAYLLQEPRQGFNFNSLFNYNLTFTLPNVKRKKKKPKNNTFAWKNHIGDDAVLISLTDAL